LSLWFQQPFKLNSVTTRIGESITLQIPEKIRLAYRLLTFNIYDTLTSKRACL